MFEILLYFLCIIVLLVGSLCWAEYDSYRWYSDKIMMIEAQYPDGSPERDFAINLIKIFFDPYGRYTLRMARKKISN